MRNIRDQIRFQTFILNARFHSHFQTGTNRVNSFCHFLLTAKHTFCRHFIVQFPCCNLLYTIFDLRSSDPIIDQIHKHCKLRQQHHEQRKSISICNHDNPVQNNKKYKKHDITPQRRHILRNISDQVTEHS